MVAPWKAMPGHCQLARTLGRWGNGVQYLEQVLVLSFHVPPASMQSPSVSAFLISSIPAKAGAVKVRPVKASARINAKIERGAFMASTPLGSETVAGFIFQHVVCQRNFHI